MWTSSCPTGGRAGMRILLTDPSPRGFRLVVNVAGLRDLGGSFAGYVEPTATFDAGRVRVLGMTHFEKAFATGRDPAHASIAVTEGLLDALNREELQAVVAHEMSHVRNYDIRLMTVVAALVGGIALISDWSVRGLRWGGGGSRRGGSRDRGGGVAGLIFLVATVGYSAGRLFIEAFRGDSLLIAGGFRTMQIAWLGICLAAVIARQITHHAAVASGTSISRRRSTRRPQ